MRTLALVLLNLTFWILPVQAQLWSGVLEPSRAINWTAAGIPTGIQVRTNICARLTSSATAAQINSAIAACPSGQVVSLAAGSYNLNAGLIFDDKSNVTLRGAGPDQTILTFTSYNACNGQSAVICLRNGSSNWVLGPINTADWTGGYTQGTTNITISANTLGSARPMVGTLLILDQLDDVNADTGGVWVCITAGICSQEGNTGQSRPGPRTQIQTVQVTAISGNNVTITPGLYMPNWRSGQTPQAWWGSDTPITGVGIEDLKINFSNSGSQYGVTAFNAYQCWVTNVTLFTGVFSSGSGGRAHIKLYQSSNNVIRSNYVFGSQHAASQSYGIEFYIAFDNLVENNIFQQVVAPIMLGSSSNGNVIGYNYGINDLYNVANWMEASIWEHAGGTAYNLLEGNQMAGINFDNIHGTHHFSTAFRNYFTGWEAGKTAQTVPVIAQSFSRFQNIVGNVFGRDTYHIKYSTETPVSTNCAVSIYALGWGGNCGSATSFLDDTLVASTMMRWGNYDTVNDASRFVNGEVPTNLAKYANTVPASQTLPASFYLPGKPSWMEVTGQPTIPYPAVGPDVTGQTVLASEGSNTWVTQSVGGHVASNAALVCYKDIMGGPADGTGTILKFNANRCYPAGRGGNLTSPAAPTSLLIK